MRGRLRGRRDLDGAGNAHTPQFPARFRLRAPPGEARIVGGGECLIHDGFELAAIVGEDQRRLIGHGVARYEIAAPEFRRVDPKPARRDIDHPFDDIRRFRAPGAAIGRKRGRVGEDARHLDMHRLGGIDAGKPANIHGRRRRAQKRQIGAKIGVCLHLEGEKFTLAAEREFHIADIVARVIVGDEALAPLAAPFHGPADPLRRPGNQRNFGIDRALHAKRAAHVHADDPHFILRHMEQMFGEIAPPLIGPLDAGIDGVLPLARIVIGERAARLHRIRAYPVYDKALAHHMGRRRNGRIGGGAVTGFVDEGLVVGIVLPNAGRRGVVRRLGRDIHGQGSVIDLDQFRRVLGKIDRFRDHHRHDLPHMADPVARQRGPRRAEHRRSVAPLAR